MQAIILSVILTPFIAYQLFLERGAFRVGGEWLLPIVVLILLPPQLWKSLGRRFIKLNDKG